MTSPEDQEPHGEESLPDEQPPNSPGGPRKGLPTIGRAALDVITDQLFGENAICWADVQAAAEKEEERIQEKKDAEARVAEWTFSGDGDSETLKQIAHMRIDLNARTDIFEREGDRALAGECITLAAHIDSQLRLVTGTNYSRYLMASACMVTGLLTDIYAIFHDDDTTGFELIKANYRHHQVLAQALQRVIEEKKLMLPIDPRDSTPNPQGCPQNFEEEATMLTYLKHHAWDKQAQKILSQLQEMLLRFSDAEKLKVGYTMAEKTEYIRHLFSQGKFEQILRFADAHPLQESVPEIDDLISEAENRFFRTIRFDRYGLPISNEKEARFAWADVKKARHEFKKLDHSDAKNHERRVQIFQQVSVVELLTKLVNRDLGYGEYQDVDSTMVGLFASVRGDLRDFLEVKEAFPETAVYLRDLFSPLQQVLEAEALRFRQELSSHIDPAFEILGPRIKGAESILLKMLKDGKDTCGDITDLIGFSVFTDTEAQAEAGYGTFKGMLKPDPLPKEYTSTWKNPHPVSGRRSLDITGMPHGYGCLIQVQFRTAEMERIQSFKLENHDAYKVLTGRKLLDKIDLNPAEYMNLLYHAIHNVRCAYEHCRTNPGLSPSEIIDLYSHKSTEGLSIVRTAA